MKKISVLLVIGFCLLQMQRAQAWGFFAHQRINRLAVFTLPPEMMGFYKHHIVYLTENAVNPDARRYAVKDEAPRHYIDLDEYGDSAVYKLPRRWEDAVKKYTEDTLMAYGIVPWQINRMKFQLTRAFKDRNAREILRLSADLGHYIGDGNVPLHTTSNYNGQMTNQKGIHGFWESRLPELFSDNYDFFVGRAEYVERPQQRAWQAVTEANTALDSVFTFERKLNAEYSPDKKYSYEQRGNVNTLVYSKAYSGDFHRMLGGQVERRMRAAIRMVGDFWYTCWVDAGQPDLNGLVDFKFSKEEQEQMQKEQQEWQKRREGNTKIREEAHNHPHGADEDHHAFAEVEGDCSCCSFHVFLTETKIEMPIFALPPSRIPSVTAK
ncbi:hypothetical protein SAMN05421780_10961 [Flexibacter flexilis DSM 6793]|uniref:S1/P1 Nuclease n=1 Tax=Flexibacter flexilis DSM 6793 TaxID=927664 RepID=A0A1I1LUP7_9BACT|nr:zinc dependent phospholipase C family protein [Flexibacter flexilis]SFC74688.1 hypothetical protein SAMN05421780_10961 [Flexibacter flexilis DSM 6793]